MPWDRFEGMRHNTHHCNSEGRPGHSGPGGWRWEPQQAGSGQAPEGDLPPDTCSKHVLTEDIVHREVTPDQKLLSRRLLTKTNRMPRWAERLFPANVAHSVYILEDSIVDPQNQTMTTFTWNINHARLMVRLP